MSSESLLGFLNIHKPLHMTSHDVVARVRRLCKRDFDTKKVGHAGTLDPLASGVLLVCLGKATRLSDYVMHNTKRYRATVQLGSVTETDDAEGEDISQTDASHITQADIEAILPQFIGTIQQIPPMYSAIKKDGKKLYELARAGQTIEREPRTIQIDAINIIDFQPNQVILDVVCGSGTYIRSLARDIGETLKVGAHLGGLVRNASGNFTLDNAIQLDDLLEDENWYQHIITPKTALADYPSIQLSPHEVQELRHGRAIIKQHEITDATVFAYEGDDLVAILKLNKNHWKPHKVFLTDT